MKKVHKFPDLALQIPDSPPEIRTFNSKKCEFFYLQKNKKILKNLKNKMLICGRKFVFVATFSMRSALAFCMALLV